MKGSVATFDPNTSEGGKGVPHIIVTADRETDPGEGAVMLRERINVADLESEHFAAQLLERLGWAVGDAHEAEQDSSQRD
jgi:hypothetical protein